jgi:hypothetical protein
MRRSGLLQQQQQQQPDRSYTSKVLESMPHASHGTLGKIQGRHP